MPLLVIKMWFPGVAPTCSISTHIFQQVCLRHMFLLAFTCYRRRCFFCPLSSEQSQFFASQMKNEILVHSQQIRIQSHHIAIVNRHFIPLYQLKHAMPALSLRTQNSCNHPHSFELCVHSCQYSWAESISIAVNRRVDATRHVWHVEADPDATVPVNDSLNCSLEPLLTMCLVRLVDPSVVKSTADREFDVLLLQTRYHWLSTA